MIEQWDELKATITELRDSGGTGTQQEVCGFLINLMIVLENQMDSSGNQNRWIPVSERLPKPFECVNCTCHSLIDDREDWVIETVYVPQPSGSRYSDWGNFPMLNIGKCEVVAWMHRNIPDPYKGKSENKE